MKYIPRTIDILSFIYTLGYFVTLGIAFFVPFPESNKDTLVLLLGILSTIMAKIVEAYFSKDSSNSATATVVRAMKTPDSLESLALKDQVNKDTK